MTERYVFYEGDNEDNHFYFSILDKNRIRNLKQLNLSSEIHGNDSVADFIGINQINAGGLHRITVASKKTNIDNQLSIRRC